jgi:GDP/UDP-N,N'-diacetylbacillosamine 2-epimerase (hydrolysing)
MKKIAFLTCGRSDFSIYLPLIKQLKKLKFQITIIAFGSHGSKIYGSAMQDIEAAKVHEIIYIDSLNKKFSPKEISLSMSHTIKKLTKVWNSKFFDLVFALGDRFEMFAAVASGVPHNVTFAHMHGGEQTLGAIDDVFRHSITHMSKLHLTSTKLHRKRVKELLGKKDYKNIHNIGSISLHNISATKILKRDNYLKKLGVPNSPYVLVTIHPETIDLDANENLILSSLKALDQMPLNKIITLPNNDTDADVIRKNIAKKKNRKDYFIFESLGVDGYFNAISHCQFMLGNSSSAIIESMYFKKYAINIGNRQLGREANNNIIHVPANEEKIIKAMKSKKFKLDSIIGPDKFFVRNAPEVSVEIIRKYLK